ncbi:MAG: ABC transporter permease subunit [Bacteroidales bacterium]|nr:ABC transporter permease subunit [Bacteroidales bacterium]
MIWHIAKKDFLLNIISARFMVGCALCLLIIPFTILTNIEDYKNQVRLYEIDRTTAETRLKETKVYSGLRPVIVRPPNPLTIFCNGINGNVGNKVKINFGDIPALTEGKASLRDNPFLNSFFSIDFINILSILISLLALIFSYDLFTREREEGTMKLSLSKGISRTQFLLGKISGVLLTLLPILILCYLLSILIIVLSKGISIGGENWINLLLIFGFSIIFMLLFVLMGAFISSRTKHSSTSIVVNLLCWIWFIFLVPNLATFISESYVRVQLYDNVEYAVKELNQEYNNIFHNEIGPEIDKELNMTNRSWWNMNGGYDGYMETSGTAKEVMEYERRLKAQGEPLRIDYADKKWAIVKDHMDGFSRQNRLQNILLCLSPSGLFEMVSAALCRSNEKAFLDFMEDVREYRETLIRHFELNMWFESYRYITAQPVDQFVSYEEQRAIAQSGNIPDCWSNNNNPVLDLEGVPMFDYKTEGVLSSLNQVLIKMILLLVVCILLSFLILWSFNQYDVR